MLPVTILTGFLGAGKTTFINYLLENNQQEKIAIVENEFGAVSIDSALLKNMQAMTLIELKNGCICCSVRGELREALHQLLDNMQAGILQIDRLILETTGLADPAPIIQTFFVDERIRAEVYLDAVVTLIDCEHGQQQLDEHKVAAYQIGFADCIVLTKLDRVSQQNKDILLTRIYQINSKAEVYEANYGVLPREAWLDINAFELSNVLQVTQGSFSVIGSTQNLSFTPFKQVEPYRSYADNIQSHVLRGNFLDLEKIGTFMQALIDDYGHDLLRYKGILAIQNEERRLIVQGIHKVVGFDYGDPWNEEIPVSLLVLIGRALPIQKIKEGFLQCSR